MEGNAKEILAQIGSSARAPAMVAAGGAILHFGITIPADVIAASAIGVLLGVNPIGWGLLIVGSSLVVAGAALYLYELRKQGKDHNIRRDAAYHAAFSNAMMIIQQLNASYYIVSAQTGLVLDAVGGGTKNGTRIILWKKNGGANQKWRILPNGQIQSVSCQKVTTVDGHFGGNGGNALVLWDKTNPPHQSQQFCVMNDNLMMVVGGVLCHVIKILCFFLEVLITRNGFFEKA